MIFLNSASSGAALVFYLPGMCTHTDTEGKQRKARVRNILKSSEKTQYLMNTLYILSYYEFSYTNISTQKSMFCNYLFKGNIVRVVNISLEKKNSQYPGNLHLVQGSNAFSKSKNWNKEDSY